MTKSERLALAGAKNSRDARGLMDRAIEDGDFERARVLAVQFNSLAHFERELDLAQTVHNYYTKKQVLSNKMGRNRQQYVAKIEQSRARKQKFYEGEYAKLKERQEAELNALLERWRSARADILDETQTEYDNALATAKLLAYRQSFEEAIKIRDSAMRQFKGRTAKTTDKIDRQFKRQCEILLDRQDLELTSLIQNRNAEMRNYDSLLQTTDNTAREVFRVQNAKCVVKIAERMPYNAPPPRSLRMQTVHAEPDEPDPQSFLSMAPSSDFEHTMDIVDSKLANVMEEMDETRSPVTGLEKSRVLFLTPTRPGQRSSNSPIAKPLY
jgi:succinate dehydrogenase flavin-adding protein (antitoxin of CptAB toxin-antitoxin module)